VSCQPARDGQDLDAARAKLEQDRRQLADERDRFEREKREWEAAHPPGPRTAAEFLVGDWRPAGPGNWILGLRFGPDGTYAEAIEDRLSTGRYELVGGTIAFQPDGRAQFSPFQLVLVSVDERELVVRTTHPQSISTAEQRFRRQ
jgi:hypothetical protein